MIRLNPSFLAIIFLSQNIFSECSFNTSDYIKELNSPSYIKSIDVEIPDSKKWSKNLLKITLDKSSNINPKYRDMFKSNIIVNYDFGSCKYSARARISGDWKDHVRFSNGKITSSLDIKLHEGNILNAVRFKLLIPETRNGINEVLGSLILKELGFISPETFLVKVDVNNSQDTYLFQENAAKEMLERNFRREGPIFEGNEDLLWSFQNFKTMELENVSLSKLSNDNWANKGQTSTIIATQAFLELQKTYLEYGLHKKRAANNNLNNNFKNYGFILLAMNGVHALYPHNRKFYFSALNQDFEPIYYDGDLRLDLNLALGSLERDVDIESFIKNVDPKIVDEYLLKLESMLVKEEIENSFLNRVINNNKAQIFFIDSIKQIIKNIETLKLNFLDLKIDNEPIEVRGEDVIFESYFERLKKKKISKFDIYSDIKLENNLFYIANSTDKNNFIQISSSDLIKIISDNTYNKRRAELISSDTKLENIQASKLDFMGGSIFYSEELSLFVDSQSSKIIINQSKPNGWLTINGALIENWSIIFNGITPNDSFSSVQRFNSFGLTGCLNIYNSIVKDIDIYVNNGQCEDSVNIINSSGNINSMTIDNAYADALDIDFSKIDIYELNVKNAQNDCFDVSGGTYSISNAVLSKCGDKALSVGEKSNLNLYQASIDDANIGISSKDFSISNIQKLYLNNVNVCLEALQKKQEFGGAFLSVDNIEKCDGSYSHDDNSNIFIASKN